MKNRKVEKMDAMVNSMNHTELVRSSRELAPLITEQIQLGDLAAEEAGMPYYRKAGSLLEEARASVKLEDKETFEEYCERVTKKSYRQCRRYIEAHHEQVAALEYARKKRISGRTRPPKVSNSLSEMEGRRSSGSVYREWREDVDKAAEVARKQQLKAAEDRATEQKRMQELARKLIDIGFKVLAKELHPDKMGGSKDAMSRLNKIRERLSHVYG